MRITTDRNPRFISLGKYLEEKDWESTTSTIKKSFSNSKNMNSFLRKELSKIDQIILSLENEEKEVTFEAIKEKYKYPVVDFIEFARKEIEVLKGKQSPKKLKEDSYIVNKLERYQKKININNIALDWLSKCEYYLRNNLQNGDNTVAFNINLLLIRKIRTLLRHLAYYI